MVKHPQGDLSDELFELLTNEMERLKEGRSSFKKYLMEERGLDEKQVINVVAIYNAIRRGEIAYSFARIQHFEALLSEKTYIKIARWVVVNSNVRKKDEEKALEIQVRYKKLFERDTFAQKARAKYWLERAYALGL